MTRAYSNSDLRGRRFGRLVVLFGDVLNSRYYVVMCDCGIRKKARKDHLLEGKSTSCGCARVQFPKARAATWKCWYAMKSRCTNSDDANYPRYGAREIRVCKRWLESFDNFLADMGYRPDGRSIERRNNNGDYKPSNCYWGTKREQSLNTRRTLWLTYNGVTQPASEWATQLGINRSTLYKRLNRSGWTVEEALSL